MLFQSHECNDVLALVAAPEVFAWIAWIVLAVPGLHWLGRDLIRKATYRPVNAKLLINLGSTISGHLPSTKPLPWFAASLEGHPCPGGSCQRSAL